MQGQPTDERWRELADLLGLDEGTPPGAKASPAAPPPPPPVLPENIRETAPPPAPVELHVVSEADDEEITWEEEFDQGDMPSENSESTQDEKVAIRDESGAEAASNEDKPRRGRRRRRRGKRRGDGERTEGGAGEAPTADESVTDEPGPGRSHGKKEDDDERRGRRRRRGRRDEEDSRPRSDEGNAPPPAKPAAIEQRGRAAMMAEDTDFSDWTVPSWQDLIASLYRPDR